MLIDFERDWFNLKNKLDFHISTTQKTTQKNYTPLKINQSLYQTTKSICQLICIQNIFH